MMINMMINIVTHTRRHGSTVLAREEMYSPPVLLCKFGKQQLEGRARGRAVGKRLHLPDEVFATVR